MARFLVTLIPKSKFGYSPIIFFIDDKLPDWMMIRLLLAGSIEGDSLNQKDDDWVFETNGTKLLIDPMSGIYFKDATIDW